MLAKTGQPVEYRARMVNQDPCSRAEYAGRGALTPADDGSTYQRKVARKELVSGGPD